MMLERFKGFLKGKDFPWLVFATVFFLSLKILDYMRMGAFFDEGVYVGMAKFFASGGSAGYFEALRPLGLPWLLVPLQFIPTSSLLTGRLLSLALIFVSVLIVFLVTRDIFGKSASGWSALVFAASPSVILFGGYILNDIFAYTLVLLSAFLILKKNNKSYFFSGLFLGLAFLFRFSAVAVFPVLVGYIILTKKRKSPVPLGIHLLGLVTGLAPYFIFNLFHYSGPVLSRILSPLGEAFGVVQTGAWIYGQSGVLSYFSYFLITESVLVVAAALGIYFLSRNKDRGCLLFLVCASFLFLFFSFGVSRFDLRYLVSVIPFLAVLAGPGIKISLDKINNRKMIFPLIIAVIIPGLFVLMTLQTGTFHDTRIESSISSYNGDLITNEARALLYSRSATELVTGPNFGNMFLLYMNGNAEWLAVNPEGYFCSPGDDYCSLSWERQLGHVLSHNSIVDCGFLHGSPLFIISKDNESRLTYEECGEMMGYIELPSPEFSSFIRIYDANTTEGGDMEDYENLISYVRLFEDNDIETYLVLESTTKKLGNNSIEILKDLEKIKLGVLETPGSSTREFIQRVTGLTGKEVTVVVPEGDDWIGKDTDFPPRVNMTITGSWDRSPVPVQRKGIDIYLFDYDRGELLNLEDFKILYDAFLKGDYEIGVDIPASALTEGNREALAEIISYMVIK